MNCQEFVDFLNAYVDEELQAEVRESFEKHMGCCPPCVDFLDGYRKTCALARAAAADEVAQGETHPAPPEGLINAILAARAECEN